MKINNFAFAVCAALVSSGCQSIPTLETVATAPVVSEERSYFPADDELRNRLQLLVKSGESKGIVLGLLEPSGKRRVISYGTAGAGEPPLSSKTAFEIGSISKTFTNVVLADMVRRGEVAFSDPVSKFLPANVKVPSRNGREIRLVDLATHTSGLPRLPTGYKIPDASNPYAYYRAEQLYEFLSRYEPALDAGDKYVYSNLGTGLLGHALARAAQVETIDELILERITAPLGMKMTKYGRSGDIGASMAKGHNAEGMVVPYWDFAVLAGAGGLNSNADDMLTYLEANIDAEGSAIKVAMRDTHEPRRSIGMQNSSIALGWQHTRQGDRTIIHHGGGTAGFQSYVGFDPSTRAGVVVLGNSAGFLAAQSIVLQLLSPGTPDLRKADVAFSEIEPLLGNYEFERGQREFFVKNKKLFMRLNGGRAFEVYSAGGDRFFYEAVSISIEWFQVKRDPNGRHVMSTYRNGSEKALLAVRKKPDGETYYTD